MDFTERLELYKEGGMIDDKAVEDVNAIIKMFKDEYGVELQEENADTFIAHICAAYSRNVTKEEVEALPDVVKNELMGLDTYEQSLEILNRLVEVTQNPLNQVEKDYALLHINNLIARFKGENNWNK